MPSDPQAVLAEGTFDLSKMPEDFQRGYRIAESHYPPFGAWRGSCGHLWDRGVEDTDDCPRCLMARALAESEKRVDRLQDVFRREASAALVREVALEDALRKYGRHLRGCSALMPTDAQYCTCGLLDAKDARAALSEPETPRPLRGQTHTGRDGGVEVDAVAWEDGTFTIAEVRGLSEPETPR